MEDKENQWNKLYENYINKEFKNWDQYFKTKMKLKKRFLNQVLKYLCDGFRTSNGGTS